MMVTERDCQQQKYIASFSGGKDSTAMVLMLIEKNYPLDEIVFFDTGWEFPDMLIHIDQVEKYIGRPITRLHPPDSFRYCMVHRQQIPRTEANKALPMRYGRGWPSHKRRWCTRDKVTTIDKYCENATRYIGYAADEKRRRDSKNLIKAKFEKIYPLIDWNITEKDALQYCYDKGFHWNGLYEHFRRVSCFCCPLQRLGELRNLRRHYPDLWQTMLKWDTEMGAANRGFRDYKTVHNMENHFAMEDRQTRLIYD